MFPPGARRPWLRQRPVRSIARMTRASPTSAHAAAAATLVKEHATLAIVASLVPVPFVEFAAVSAVHLRMIEDLTREYGKEFQLARAKAVVAATLSGCASYYLDSYITGTLAKFIPGLGSWVAIVTLPSVAGGLTYALGRVYTRHLEAGGSLFDFQFAWSQPGFLQEVERNRVDASELARVIGSRTAAGAASG